MLLLFEGLVGGVLLLLKVLDGLVLELKPMLHFLVWGALLACEP